MGEVDRLGEGEAGRQLSQSSDIYTCTCICIDAQLNYYDI